MRHASIFQSVLRAETKLQKGLRLLALVCLIMPGIDNNQAQAADLTWTGNTNTNWDTTTQNWLDGINPDSFTDNDSVTFDGTSSVTTVTVQGPHDVINMTVSDIGYTLAAGTNPTVIATGIVLVNAPGSLTLNPDAILQIGNGGASGDLDGTITNNGILVFFRNDSGGLPYVLSSPIAGNGTLRFRGTGASSESAYQGNASNTTFTGNVIIENGARLELTNSSASTGNSIAVENGGSLWLETGTTYSSPIFIAGNGWLEGASRLGALRMGGNAQATGVITLTGAARIGVRNSQATISGVIGDGGNGYALEKTESGTLILTANNTYTGGTTISSGILQIGNDGNTGSITGDIINNATLEFRRSDDITHNGTISGTGALIKAGSGALVLTGNNTYTGDTTINSGVLRIGDNGNTGSISGDIINNAVLEFRRSDDITSSSTISGTGALIKAGSGALVLDAANTYTGGTDIQAGVLRLANAAGVGNGGIAIASGALLDLAAPGDYSLDNIVSGQGGLRKTGTGTVDLIRANTYTSGTDIQAGVLRLANAAGMGSGGITIASGALLDLAAPGNYSLDNLVSGQGGLRKTETGTVALTTASIALGSLNVDQGVLNLSGILEARNIGVAANSTLSAGSLLLAGGNTLALNNQGIFTYNRLEIVGTGNRVTGALPAAAGRNLHFALPASITGGGTMLSVDSPGLDINGATLSLSATGELASLLNGDTITLINNTTGTIANPDATYTAAFGASEYAFILAELTSSLGIVYTAPQNNVAEAAQPYLESAAAGMAALAEGGRFVSSQGVSGMVNATSSGPGTAVMAGASGSSYREHSGSHVDIDGISALSGPVARFDNSLGITRLGLFVEAGRGNYDTFNSFSTGAVNGDGDLEHYGGGILTRHDCLNGLYAEASFRAGAVKTEFASGDMGIGAAFDSDAAYFGAHTGLGWIWNITEQDSVDFYAKAFWTRQNGDNVTTEAGESLKLKDADSLSTRIGSRYTRHFTKTISAYAGAAWDKEFDGKQRGTLDGVAVKAPSLAGDSALAELGLVLNPGNSAWSIELNIHGNLGQREGAGVNLGISFEF